MSIVDADGIRRELTQDERMVDLMLAHRRAIGDRRWGIVHLYYRAGLSMQEVADVFGINRQMVNYELRRAAGIVVDVLAGAGRRARWRRQSK